MKVEFFTPSTFGDCDIRPDKYIRSIIKNVRWQYLVRWLLQFKANRLQP